MKHLQGLFTAAFPSFCAAAVLIQSTEPGLQNDGENVFKGKGSETQKQVMGILLV